jgi:hypothetical protein
MAKPKLFTLTDEQIQKHVSAGIVTVESIKLTKNVKEGDKEVTHVAEGKVYQGKNLAGITALCGGVVEAKKDKDGKDVFGISLVGMANKAFYALFRGQVNAVLTAKAEGMRKVFETLHDKLAKQGVPGFQVADTAKREAKIQRMIKDATDEG